MSARPEAARPGPDRLEEQTVGFRRVATPIRELLATQNSAAVVLLAAAVAALLWANSPWSGSYESFWTTSVAVRFGDADITLELRAWVNQGLMAFFFFFVGLEVRREFDMGELRERRRVATPVLAAFGGMVVPALIYLALNIGRPSVRGWGIPMGTDTAFAIGILTLVGGRFAPKVRTFLLTLVIVDDVVSLVVIAVAYTSRVSMPALVTALALTGLVLVMRASAVRNGVPYFLVGLALWLAVLASGIHATIVGIAMGLLVTAYPPSRADLEQVGSAWRVFREEPTPEYARTASLSAARAISPNERLQHLFRPWASYVIVPLFALANAGVVVNGDVLRNALSSPVTHGIVAGLVVGKPVGIVAATWLATRRGLGGFPLAITWPPLIGAGVVAGIGFTVALLIADISFRGPVLEDAKVGILSASILASILAWIAFRVIERLPKRILVAGHDRLAEPIPDLLEPVDEDVDHVRGPNDAPVTLVEYGDFECPHCGRAEPGIRHLLESFGSDLRFVWRHLPLTDVHPHAELAAEAAEAAAAQGRFWQMYDLLFAEQHALTEEDLLGYARQLALDESRFIDDVRARRYSLRVARDAQSADESGVAGTPTFFVNGRRHVGAYDESTLASLVRDALRAQAIHTPV